MYIYTYIHIYIYTYVKYEQTHIQGEENQDRTGTTRKAERQSKTGRKKVKAEKDRQKRKCITG
jgi:hypothetical protein